MTSPYATVALSQRNRHDEAQAMFRKALSIDPGQAHVWNNLGYVLLLAGNPREAITALKTAVKLNRDNAPMCGSSYFMLRKTPLSLMSMTSSHMASEYFATGMKASPAMPAYVVQLAKAAALHAADASDAAVRR